LKDRKGASAGKVNEVRIGVIGVGHLGTYHLQKYSRLEGNRIVGVADIDEERAHRAASAYSCEATRDYRNLFGEVDAVSIAVPTEAHYEVAREFLAAGCDVLLEKPMAASMVEADELLAVAQARGAILQIGLVERFNPAIVALREVMAQPLFIEAHRLHPFFERGTDVDVILDLMIHDLDCILAFVDSPLVRIEAVGVPVLSSKIDIANVRLSFESGCVANITASRISVKTMQKIRFFEMNGYHAVDYGKRELVSFSRKGSSTGAWEIRENNVSIRMQDPLEEEIRAFLAAVRTRTEPLVSGTVGRKCPALALQIIEQMKTLEEA
jgi:predicted dehydrogenase